MLARECFLANKSLASAGSAPILPYPNFVHSGANIDFTSILLHVRIVKHATPSTLERALLAK
eukprot:1404957-Prymnesium_polylepis.1